MLCRSLTTKSDTFDVFLVCSPTFKGVKPSVNALLVVRKANRDVSLMTYPLLLNTSTSIPLVSPSGINNVDNRT